MVTLNTSWDVWKHGHAPIELYGEEGTIFVPDPNFFGGDGELHQARRRGEEAAEVEAPAVACRTRCTRSGRMANYRTVGLADMAVAIRKGGRTAARWSWRCMRSTS